MTLKEIAKEAGVSAMTVSNVINQRTGKMSEATRARVQAVIDKHHFVPNLSARSLSAANSRIVVLLLPLWGTTDYNLLEDSYLSWMVGALETKLRAAGYYVMLRSFRTVEDILTVQRNWQVDGCLLLTPYDEETTQKILRQTTVPTVVMDAKYDEIPSLSVLIDDEGGGRLAASYLLAHGHRKLAICGEEHSSVIGKRFVGFLAEVKRACCPAPLCLPGSGIEGGRSAARIFCGLTDRPTALFATTDLIALGFLLELQEQGLSVPKDCSLIGFDDLKQDAWLTPPLTSIGQDLEHKASQAVDYLLQAMEDPAFRDASVTLPVRVVERASVADWEESK